MRLTKALTEEEKNELHWFVYELPRPLSWELFCTVTFKKRRGLFEASAAYLAFMNRQVPKVTHFWAVERNPSGDGGHHVHALWAGCEDLSRRQVWGQAFHQLGRSRIEPIRSNDEVTMYCTKYVAVEGALIDWKLNKGCHYQRPLERVKRAPGLTESRSPSQCSGRDVDPPKSADGETTYGMARQARAHLTSETK